MIIMEIQVLKYFIHINLRDGNKFFFIIEFKLSALLNSRIQPSNNYTIEIRANRTPKVLIKIIMNLRNIVSLFQQFKCKMFL